MQIKGVQNSSQQLAISFTHNNAPSSGIGASDGGAGGGINNGGSGQASPSIGFAYRRTPRSLARIRPRGLGVAGGSAGDNDAGGDGIGNSNSNPSMPPPSSSRLLSEGALTPAGKSGILSPDAYLSGGVKRLNIPPDTEERRPRFSAQRPLIRPATPPIAGGAGAPRRSVAVENGDGGGGNGNGSGSAGVEETKGGGVATTSSSSSATPRGNTGGGGGGTSASPEGSARRQHHHRVHAGLTSPPPSGGVGTDVRAAAGGADESLVLDGSPGAGAGASQLFPEGNGDVGGVACRGPPRLDLEGYYTVPSMSELASMGDDALRAVSDFEVIKHDIGSIKWKEPVDLRGVDIGRVVSSAMTLLHRVFCGGGFRIRGTRGWIVWRFLFVFCDGGDGGQFVSTSMYR